MTLLSFVIILIAIHEMGHLEAMRKYGIEVARMAIGIPVRYLTVVIRHRRILDGVPLHLSPILLIGFVEPKDPESVGKLGTAEQLEIFGAGIIANLSSGVFCLGIASGKISILILFFLLSIGIELRRKWICVYVFPVLSILTLPLLVFQLIAMSHLVLDAGKHSSEVLTAIHNTTGTIRESFKSFGLFSLLLAAGNLMPLGPLDGGQIMATIAKKFIAGKYMRVYRATTTVLVLVMLLICTYDMFMAIGRILWKAMS